MIADAEAYVCALYGKMKLRSVNEAWIKIFLEKYNKNKRIIELSMLPPCRANLVLHLKRANYVSYLMWSTKVKPNIDHFTEHGWTEDGGSIWSQEYLPEDIQQILYDDAVAQIKKDEGENEVDDLLDTEEDNDDIDERMKTTMISKWLISINYFYFDLAEGFIMVVTVRGRGFPEWPFLFCTLFRGHFRHDIRQILSFLFHGVFLPSEFRLEKFSRKKSQFRISTILKIHLFGRYHVSDERCDKVFHCEKLLAKNICHPGGWKFIIIQ